MSKHTTTRLTKAVLTAVFGCLLIACGDPAAEKQQQALSFVTSWFDKARQGARDESLCHGLGLLKHPTVNCASMLEAAANIDGSQRTIEGVYPQECFSGVCGEFVEIRFTGQDLAGNPAEETALLKRDEGQFRLYWYRNTELIEGLVRAQPKDEDEGKDPVQVAYDELVAKHPTLYSYPPCYGIRASSNNLAGELQSLGNVNVAELEQLAQTCPETFCFSLVGQKIAPLCPGQ